MVQGNYGYLIPEYWKSDQQLQDAPLDDVTSVVMRVLQDLLKRSYTKCISLKEFTKRPPIPPHARELQNFWYGVDTRNPRSLDEAHVTLLEAIDWARENHFIVFDYSVLDSPVIRLTKKGCAHHFSPKQD